MSTFLIDDEAALCRYLAAKQWTQEFVTEDDKKLQERLRRENAEVKSRKFQSTLDEIMRNKCRTGGEDPRKKKKQLEDKFTETVVVVA
jgi:uncharacterized protein YnzC (UPF0291/DUF896 family)